MHQRHWCWKERVQILGRSHSGCWVTVDRGRWDAIAASSSPEGLSGKERVAFEGAFCFLPANHPECLNTALVVFFLEAMEGLALLWAQCKSRALPATCNCGTAHSCRHSWDAPSPDWTLVPLLFASAWNGFLLGWKPQLGFFLKKHSC